MSRWLLSVVALGGLAFPLFAQKSPEETVKSMTVADGLQVELFAAEPMLINPTSIDVDHLGRVWVCEAVNYRRVGFKRPILREEGDRIVILTDKDGDGKADDSSVFYQGKDLYGPLGIAVAATPRAASFSYKVFVCQSPDILLFEDKDGDGKADGPPKKFLTNFGGFDHDHGVHGINIGPDGKLYFTVGDSGVNGLQSADGKGRKYFKGEKDCQAGTVWRCDFDGNNLELIAHNFRNNYECCVNSFGEIWLSDNDDDGNQQTRICHVMPGGNYGYYPRGPGQTHWHEEQPGIVHKTMRTGFGSPTGICFYEGTLLPKRFHGQLLHTDAGPRELRAFHIKPKGAGYELEKENLVTSTDNWYRLSDVCVAPDGSVMLADWYDPGVGGHGMGDWKMGRIYRVTPKGHKGYKVPEVKLETKEGVLAALHSPCLAMRALAIARLEAMPPADAARDIFRGYVAADEPQLARLQYRIYQSIRRSPEISKTVEPNKAFTDVLTQVMPKSPRLAAQMVRIATDIYGETPVEAASIDVPDPKWRAVTDPNSRELLIGLRKIEPKTAAPIWYRLALQYDGQDIFFRAALNIACGTDPKRREAILADFDKHFPEWTDKVADLVWELRPASVLPRLGKLLEDAKLTAAQKGRIVDILAASDDATAGKTMISLLGRDLSPEIKSRAIDNLNLFLPTKWNDLAKSDELKKAIELLLKDEKTAITGLQLIAAANAVDRVGDVIELASNKPVSRPVQLEALRTLGKLRTLKSVETLRNIASDLTYLPAPAAGMQAINALAALITGQGKDEISSRALAALQEQLPRNDYPEMQKAAVSGLAGSQTGTTLLLDMAEKKKLPESLVADTGRLLRNSPFQGLRNRALLLFPAPGKLDPKKLPPISELVKRTGDAARGEAVLKASLKSEAQCLRCHTVRGVGGNIGPDQSMIGKKASRENLFESIMLPSKAIADQQLQWKITTLDEKTVTGLLVEETPTSITLRDANGKDHTFATKDLDGPKQKSLVSIMPDNLVAALTEDELIDLVEYMLTLKTASISPERWYIAGPFPGGNNNVGLDQDHGPKRGPFDAKTQFKGKNDIVIGWRRILPNAVGYIDLAAYHGDIGADSVSYLYAEVDSPIDQDGTILIGHDDGANVYVNSELKHTEKVTRAAAPEQNKVAVKLKKGKNTIMIQIANGSNPHGMYFALTSEQELKLGK